MTPAFTLLSVIWLSMMVFFIIIMLFVVMLLIAKAKLTTQGMVTLTINDDKQWQVAAGQTVLNSLSTLDILLPSACGGKGTCGMCKCRVVEGGGSILPSETIFFNRKERLNNWRLACQTKVQENVSIEIPPEVMEIKKWVCEVISNRNVAAFIKECIIKLPQQERLDFRAGAYIQIYVPKVSINYSDIAIDEPYKSEWTQMGMWDLQMTNREETYRVYSMANYPGEGETVTLNVRIAAPPITKLNNFKKVNPGICSSFIFSRKAGDKVIISGPYGEFYVKGQAKELMFIGGGAGMAPLRSQIFDLLITRQYISKVSYWYGARSKIEIYYEEDFRNLEKQYQNFRFEIALSEPKGDDNWSGHCGFISDVIYKEYLSKHEEPEEIEYYICGPPKMHEATMAMLYNLGVPDSNISFDEFS
ncbi:NADH:ubiquinone reductase (Na(+)-transporting) subunit F [Carboxylicivirga sediminis]|uniref:Na(+)-translocating NADH-quinone reductase subunit F n=1 Tax=Carboxylicivirga sediminis TaxID=2006564 RepID=A0A941J185_9BACT|nr:NADH:ubiquinone reductase (Na(+)-transporting) subunit F [Carboxylicivirga sediminis]MBR8537732.1 NADH:ubiquinone reductase (Na(+)-transporting) subunit F [Carboxylicivirga sediminis]